MATITKTIESNSIEQTIAAGAELARSLKPGAVVGLIGELGAGKTQFVRGMAIGVGINPKQVSSPTFVLMQEYENDNLSDSDSALVLVHIDACRLGINSEHDTENASAALATIGWENSGKELRQGAIVAIEWADLFRHCLDNDTVYVTISHTEKGRHIEIYAPDENT